MIDHEKIEGALDDMAVRVHNALSPEVKADPRRIEAVVSAELRRFLRAIEAVPGDDNEQNDNQSGGRSE